MNCRQFQQDILDSLAAGVAFPSDVARHIQQCAPCAVFAEEQQELLGSIQSGLEFAMNRPVPASLIPSLRARLEKNPASRPPFLAGWKVVALPAVLVLVIALAFIWRGSLHRESVAVHRAPAVIPDAPIAPTTALNVTPSPSKPKPDIRHAMSVPEASGQPGEPEVIVLPEEREAFDHFIAQVPDNPEVILALTRPQPEGKDSAVQIALLAIKPLQVKSLESAEE